MTSRMVGPGITSSTVVAAANAIQVSIVMLCTKRKPGPRNPVASLSSHGRNVGHVLRQAQDDDTKGAAPTLTLSPPAGREECCRRSKAQHGLGKDVALDLVG